jgi:hypothetical protein
MLKSQAGLLKGRSASTLHHHGMVSRRELESSLTQSGARGGG